ncbi:GTP-binding protein [Bifidobacterium sp. GSD1FS]|uniref:GTP-binding protein n=1 Tax=Bifidobacterium canis TaxID=2610880 RepID=A0A7K1J7K4_9BIFI|nr:GTP-binding protein [Bifidobacterium canis]
MLDYAILVVSAADGIQGHTQTLWRLLKQYQVPTFIFVNKMDMPDASRARMLAQLQERFADSCVDFTETNDSFTDEQTIETIALQSEDAMNQFLENGVVDLTTTRQLISQRLVFPVYFGSALKMEGIREFITGFEKFTVEPEYPKSSARAYSKSRTTRKATA